MDIHIHDIDHHLIHKFMSFATDLTTALNGVASSVSSLQTALQDELTAEQKATVLSQIKGIADNLNALVAGLTPPTT